MSGTALDAVLDHLRADLFRRAEKLGASKLEMFSRGVFTGYANALHQISPACSSSINEALYWHGEGAKYLDEYEPSTQAVSAIAALREDDRVEVFHKFCTSCGRADPGCHCWNDE